MSEENNGSEWIQSLPEPLRDAPFIGKAESLDDAVGKLAHAATLVGTSIRIPDENATDEDRAAFYEKLSQIPDVARMPSLDDEEATTALLAKLGRPEEHTGYKLPEVENFDWDEGMAEDLRKYAFDANLTTAQFQKFARNIAAQEQEANRDSNQSLEDARKELRLDWGDTLEDREALIRGYMEASNAPQAMRELLDNRNLDLKTMNWLHSVAKSFKGDVNPIGKQGDGAPPGLTPAEARDRQQRVLDQIVGMNPSDPRYGDLQKELIKCSEAIASTG